MPKMTDSLSFLFVLTLACSSPKDDDQPILEAPDPIGPELLSFQGGRDHPLTCGGGYHLYREGREIQSQCFSGDGTFKYEDRGTLTVQAAEKLDAEIAAADLNETEPVNYLGSCGSPDSVGIFTLWVGDESIQFEPNCLIRGIVSLYEHVDAIARELGACGEGWPELLESIEPGCRSY